MPAIASHYYFGQKVLGSLSEDAAKKINKHKDAFNLGLQGPDIFFYYKPLSGNAVKKYGNGIHHEKALGFISSAIANTQENDYALAYLLGFICHFSLDCECHRLINKTAPVTIAHYRLETEIDRQIILNHFKNKRPNYKRYQYITYDKSILKPLKLIYSERTVKEIKKSLKDMILLNRFLLQPNGYIKKFMRFIEKAFMKSSSFSYLIVTEEEDESYSTAARQVIRLFKNAEKAAVSSIEKALMYAEGKGTLPEAFNYDFEGGNI